MTGTVGLVIRPLRFTDDVPSMQAFLEVLGLRPRVEAEAGGWVDMVAGGGMVALHEAATSDSGGVVGQTRLSFEANDLDALATRLIDAGVPEVAVYDETYGKVLTCRDPLGDTMTIDGRSEDLYGYRLHPAAAASSVGTSTVGASTMRASAMRASTMRVSPVRFTDPHGPYVDFLGSLGLEPHGSADAWYAAYAVRGGDDGLVGLHHPLGHADSVIPGVVPGPCAVKLNFASPEPLDDLAARLVAAGYDAAVCREEFGSSVAVTDPDGQQVQIHQVTPA